jgi:subtilisin family serine protease
MRVADTRDFAGQAARLEALGDAEAVVFPEIGSALIAGPAFASRSMATAADADPDSPIEVIEPEYFAFADALDAELYLRGFSRAVEAIAQDLRGETGAPALEEEVQALGATWGLVRCRVPQSTRSGVAIKLAVLDTGMDLGHPDFAGRPIVSETFAGQPVQDVHGHGTHCIGTSSGPQAPAGTTPRYGIAYQDLIHVGKVLTNAGSGATAGILAGMNWAVANRCAVISMSLGAQTPVQAAYTAAGSAALSNGCLIVAAAGNASAQTGSPANSPTIMSVASLDTTLTPSSFSNFGKIEIAAPGRDIFSSLPRPRLYGTLSGTSMATPHVAGCAALWAQTSAGLRGLALWKKLQTSARALSLPANRVGAGLVQAP